jgi:ABC-type sugar transport system ATPase subunit
MLNDDPTIRQDISIDLAGSPRSIRVSSRCRMSTMNIRGGEVVGLIGENGAGKSTLMKVLGGAIAPDGGRIHRLTAQPATSHAGEASTSWASRFVHQELNPFSNLDVTANVLLGREITAGPLRLSRPGARWKERSRRSLTCWARVSVRSDPVSELSLADQQLLEIARALSMNARLVILDEPTSSLTLSETNRPARSHAGNCALTGWPYFSSAIGWRSRGRGGPGRRAARRPQCG